MIVATKNLPAQLKNLVKSVLNVRVVSVELTTGPAEIWTSWRTGRTATLGKVLKTVSESRRGCDGESNDSTTTHYTLPVVVGTPKCGRHTKNTARLHIGNLSAATVALFEGKAELNTTEIAILLDESLSNEAKTEHVKFECDLVADWEGNAKQIIRFTGSATGKHTLWLSETDAERCLAHWMGYKTATTNSAGQQVIVTTPAPNKYELEIEAVRNVAIAPTTKTAQVELMEQLGLD